MVITHPVTGAERVRLHITPFNHDLLDKLLPASLQSQASDISFHSIPTFPERGFGYVNLPEMEARNLKKKFNGTILKGSKVRVEEAKPEKKRKSEQLDALNDEQVMKKPKKEKKRKSENGVLPGRELEKGRIVKRGWTEGTKTSRTNKGKTPEATLSLKDKKMRFKTSLPPNSAIGDPNPKKKAKGEKERKAKNAKVSVVVNEFSKATRFLAPKSSHLPQIQAVSYEDGKGWLDANGDVVEAEPSSRTRQRGPALNGSVPEDRDGAKPKVLAETGLRLSSVDDDGSKSSKYNASSSDESESEASAPSSDSDDEQSTSLLSSTEDEESSSASTDASKDETLTVGDESQPAMKEIHPLEALYKRPKSTSDDVTLAKRPTPIDTSFSFFDLGEADHVSIDGSEQPLPQTPHTKKDLEWRTVRSAAPTPDTALPGKRFTFALTDEDEDEDEDEEMEVDQDDTNGIERNATDYKLSTEQSSEKENESEFRKWFYDNRGDLNRAWKKRRREEKKLQRQRENRRLSRKIA